MQNNLDKQETMKLYFACMDSADFGTAERLFAADAVYLRPPLASGGAPFATSGTERIEGLPAIAGFWQRRGKRSTHHSLEVQSVTGSEWFAEGLVSVGDSEQKLFLCHVTFNDDGLITRFVAIR
jgi:hypothetical protein